MGLNNYGQLGDGAITNRPTPVKVKNLAGIKEIAGGYDYSLALKEDDTVWAWGRNSRGQLGNNSTVDSYVPVQVNLN